MRRAALLVVVVLVTVITSDLAGLRRTESSHNLPGLARVRAHTGGGTSAILSTGYDLTWYTIDNGGDMFSAGGGYSLGGTIGQPDAGAWSGGEYTLVGGFWGGSAPTPTRYHIYLPVVLRGI